MAVIFVNPRRRLPMTDDENKARIPPKQLRIVGAVAGVGSGLTKVQSPLDMRSIQ